MNIKMRRKNVEDQLSWLYATQVIYHYSTPGQGQPKWRVVTQEYGPGIELSLREAEMFISGALTVWRHVQSRKDVTDLRTIV